MNKNLIEVLPKVVNHYKDIREIPQNKGWYDKEFEKSMIAIGWHIDWAWCCLFDKKCVKEAMEICGYPEDFIKEYLKLYNPSSLKTLQNMKKAGYVIEEPVAYCTVIYDEGHGKGHTEFFIEKISKGLINCIGGNVSNRVKEVTRSIDSQTMKIAGYFIYPDNPNYVSQETMLKDF